MHTLIREVQKAQLKKVPEVKTGYTIRVHQKIKEGGKERVQAFEGLVIKVGHGEGVEKTITVRRVVQGIGVEKVFPVNSPNITKIEVKKKAKVRRAKLYYMRERSGKSARLQERHVTEAERAAEEEKMEAMIQEAVSADEKRKKEEVATEVAEGEDPEASPDAESADTQADAEPEAPESSEPADTPEPAEEESEKEPESEPEAEAPSDEPQAEDAEKKADSDSSDAESDEASEDTDASADDKEEEKAA